MPKQTNKNPKPKQKITEDWVSIASPPIVRGDVWWVFPPLAFPQSYRVFYFLERGQYCWPSHHLYSGESNGTHGPSFSLPTIGQGSHHPGGLWEEGHPLWLLCWWCWGCCAGLSVQEPPSAIKSQIKGFSLVRLGKPELLQSAVCQLSTRSQEVVLAARRWGSSGFVFLLSLSGIVLSSC